MTEDKPDAIVIHVVSNDILNHANHEDIACSIKNTLLDCKNDGVSEVFISSILVRKNPSLSYVDSMTCLKIYERKMLLVLFVMMLLQLIIYRKMVFSCRTLVHIFQAIFFELIHYRESL